LRSWDIADGCLEGIGELEGITDDSFEGSLEGIVELEGMATRSRESQVFPTKKLRSTNQVNSTRFLKLRHQTRAVPMTSLKTGLVTQAV
jgi:hypothetical protein